MKYMTCQEAASLLGLTIRRVQQMCKNGMIPGAIKKGRSWMIPKDSVEKNTTERHTDKSTEHEHMSDRDMFDTDVSDMNGMSARSDTQNMTDISELGKKKKPLPIGISDFKLATTEYYYVDKTLLIRDFLDQKPMVSLFTRPRRFGKTLTMDMLRVFFEKTQEDTSVYFRDKKIWQCGKKYTDYQGRYPVIFLTFKDVKCASWEETHTMICKLVSMEYQRHMELAMSSRLNEYEKEQFLQIARGNAENVVFQMALQILSMLLSKHYGEKAIIIIDEYDTPIQQGYICGFYTDIISFMRNFFSGGLKDNPHLAYGFLTGILRVAKESIFSGLNNLKINSILDNAYSQYFGFTMDEVTEILDYYGAHEKIREVCDWYDGYLFGNTEIVNPWSVINYISDGCFPKAFWQSTGSNDIIGEIIAAATPEITENLHKLLCGQNITAYIDTSVIYPEIQKNPYSIYSFLLVAGYLRVSAIYPQHDGNFMCDVGIPNKEIVFVYEKEILNKMNQNSMAISVQRAVFSGDAEQLQSLLNDFMLHSISSMDGTGESFYHGMMLGLCAILSSQYQVRSNRESGYGRFDVMLIPQNRSLPGFIYEFKHTKDKKENLEQLAEKALEQIDERNYDTELADAGVEQVVKIGIAFRGKKAVVKKL